MILALKRGRDGMVYQGDRFATQHSGGGLEALWRKAIKFPTRDLAAQYAHYLKRQHARPLRGWRLAVTRL